MSITKLGNEAATADGVLERIAVSWDPPLEVTLTCTEFTCRCPVTQQPDWASIVVQYTPSNWIVESKSFKLYLETYREQGIFHEPLAQAILKDLVTALSPTKCSVTAHFNTRGGIAISAEASYGMETPC